MNTRRTFLKLAGAVLAGLGFTSHKADKPILSTITDKKSIFDSRTPGGNRYRGEYSWIEMEALLDGSVRPKLGGRFGIAGQEDAAHEIHKSNANLHLKGKILYIVKKHGMHWFTV